VTEAKEKYQSANVADYDCYWAKKKALLE